MFTILRISLLALLLSASASALAKKDLPFSTVYVLGTSLSDEGNAFIQCGMQSVPPYDNLTPQLYAPGDSPYARGGHHFSNGATWVEKLAKELGVANSVLPVRRNPQGTNYAQAGTTAFPFPDVLPCRTTFSNQVDEVLARGSIPADALVVVEIGANDVFNALDAFVGALVFGLAFDEAKAFAIGNVINPAASVTASGIHDLIDGGATKVLWANVPNIGLTPAVTLTAEQLAQPPFNLPSFLFKAVATEFATTFNVAVENALQGKIDSGTIVKLDLFDSLTQLVMSDMRGLNNVSELCVTPNVPPFACRKPDEYLFWDSIHPTKAGHELFAEDALRALGLI
jgi:outer membrane lipase/esterase